MAERVIDCTGDADIANLAGAEYRYSGQILSLFREINFKKDLREFSIPKQIVSELRLQKKIWV